MERIQTRMFCASGAQITAPQRTFERGKRTQVKYAACIVTRHNAGVRVVARKLVH